MPTPIDRTSLTKTLEDRYSTQSEGGAFSVKKELGQAGKSPNPSTTLPINSQKAKTFLSPYGFLVKEMRGVTQFKDAIDSNTSPSPKSKQLSTYVSNFSNRKYKP